MNSKAVTPEKSRPLKGLKAECKPLPQLELFTDADPKEDLPPPTLPKPPEAPYQFRTRFFDID